LSVGVTVVAGMATATLLSLFFIPVLYYAVQTLVDKLQGPQIVPTGVPPDPANPASRGEGGRP